MFEFSVLRGESFLCADHCVVLAKVEIAEWEFLGEER